MKRIFCFSIIVLSLALAPRKGFGQWVQTNGPYGASALSITRLGNDVFIGAVGGIFESTDGGSSWQRKSNGLPKNPYIYSLTTRGSNIFAGSSYYGLFRSTDSGASWIQLSLGFPKDLIVGIDQLCASEHTVYVPAGGYLFVSSNDGIQWRIADTNLTRLSNPGVLLTIDSVTFAAGSWVTETTDEGLSWIVTGVPPADSTWDIIGLGNIGEVLIAYDETIGIMRSTNHGQSWDRGNKGLPEQKIIYYFGFTFATIGSEIFAGGSDGLIYRSTDSAQSWQLASSGLPNGTTPSALESLGTELLAGYNGYGIFRSFDSGRTWSSCNQGLINTCVNAIASVGDTTIVGTSSGVFLSPDNGVTWQSKQNGIPTYNIAALLIDGDNLYVGALAFTNNHCLFLSTDRGESWSLPDNGFAENRFMAIARSGNNLLVGEEDNLYWSSNEGESWNKSLTSEIIALFKVGSKVFAGTNNGVYVSSDDGITWDQSSNGITFRQQLGINTLGMAGPKMFLNRLGLTTIDTGAIFVSDDTGMTWYRPTDSSFPLRGEIKQFASVGNALLAATDSDGIFLTTDYGVHWKRENLGLTDSSIVSIAVQGDEVIAGTSSSGVWKRPFSEIINPNAVEVIPPVEQEISCYPNPFSATTTISITNNTSGLAEISVINLLSQEVVHIFSGNLSAGEHEFVLSSSGLTEGVYECIVRIGEEIQVLPIVLSRF